MKPAVRLTSLLVLFAISISVGAVTALVLRFVGDLEVDRLVKPGDDFYLFANGSWLGPASRVRIW